MSYKDRMARELEDESDISVPFHQSFGVMKHNSDKNIVHCFFEGEDPKYYISRINHELEDQEIEIHDCRKKDNVVLLHKKIKESIEYKNLNLLFFIDRDFEISPNYSDDIYVTPCHSIENLYIHDTVIKNFISTEMNIRESSLKDEDREDYNRALKFFIDKREEFISNVELLNIWYSLQSKAYGKDIKPNLEKFKSIDIDRKINIEYLKQNTENYIEIDELEYKKEQKRLNQDPLSLYRGKYYAQFLVKTINILVTKEAVELGILHKVRKIKSTISESNLISELSNYACTPKSLKLYLYENLNKYKKTV